MSRNKVFSFINIAGLSVGVACCLILLLYIQDEVNYDKHHQDGDRVFRINSAFHFEDYKPVPRTSPPIAWGIKDEIPEFEAVARVVNPPGVTQSLIRYQDDLFYEQNGLVADSTVFDLLTYEFLEGNPEKALTHPNNVVICDDLARRLFGNESALDKVIRISQGGPEGDFKITGVFSNDRNSHLKANFLTSISSSGWADYIRRSDVADEWAGQNFTMSYVRLAPGYSLPDVVEKMNAAFQKHGGEDLKALGMDKKLSLEAVPDIYLHSTTENKVPRITYLYVIASIAVFILLIACINFMNLSTAKATKRAMEIGLRKSLGAQKGLLVRQFLSETMVTVLLAVMLSCIVIQVSLPAFNEITGKSISFDSGNMTFILLSLAGITLITGLAAGGYPAFYLSSFQPAGILKGKSDLQASNGLLRRSLVVFQFVIAITLVCGMIIIIRQLTFMQEQNLGFSVANKIVLPLRTATARANFVALRDELQKLPGVAGITGTNNVPGDPIFSNFSLYPRGSSMEKAVLVRNTFVEPNYLDVMQIKILAGNDFSWNRNTESRNKVILNREAAKQLGFAPEEIVGEKLYFDWQGDRYEFEAIGVMENYHQLSLKEEIYPLLFRVDKSPADNFIIADVTDRNIKEAISVFETTWKEINRDTPFEYHFLDEDFEKQYEGDRKVSTVISIFTAIALIISCLGLYGLLSYMAERRIREIGIRKVLGANVGQIVSLMSGEFVKLVLIAFVIAIPLSLYCITQWLERFAYKISPDITLYTLAGSIALSITLLTVGFESIRAARRNPVDALRSD